MKNKSNISQIILFICLNIFIFDTSWLFYIPNLENIQLFVYALYLYREILWVVLLIFLIGLLIAVIKIGIVYTIYRCIKNKFDFMKSKVMKLFRNNKLFKTVMFIFWGLGFPLLEIMYFLGLGDDVTISDFLYYLYWYHSVIGVGYVYIILFSYWHYKDKQIKNKK